VSGLQQLMEEKTFPVSELMGFEKTRLYKKNFIPEGPLLVHVH
jgi:hypothetical protein